MYVCVEEKKGLQLWLSVSKILPAIYNPHTLPTHVQHCDLLLQEFSQFWGDDCPGGRGAWVSNGSLGIGVPMTNQ